MAHTVDSIDITGFRKAHLAQLAGYIHDRDSESIGNGYYVGNKEQFEKRHADLLKFADRLMEMYNDSDLRIKPCTK